MWWFVLRGFTGFAGMLQELMDFQKGKFFASSRTSSKRTTSFAMHPKHRLATTS